MVNNACPIFIISKARQQVSNWGGCVIWMQSTNLFIRQVCKIWKQAGQVASHVRIWPIPNSCIWNLLTCTKAIDSSGRQMIIDNIIPTWANPWSTVWTTFDDVHVIVGTSELANACRTILTRPKITLWHHKLRVHVLDSSPWWEGRCLCILHAENEELLLPR